RSTHVNTSTNGRENGYRRAMRQYQAPIRFSARACSSLETSEFGYVIAQELLRKAKPPFAFVGHDSMLGFGAWRAACAAGFRYLDDFVVGSVGNENDDTTSRLPA